MKQERSEETLALKRQAVVLKVRWLLARDAYIAAVNVEAREETARARAALKVAMGRARRVFTLDDSLS